MKAKIIAWHKDQRTAKWVREKLGISPYRLTELSQSMGLRWPAGSTLSALCPLGHDAAHVGYKDGRCGKCSRKFPLPDSLIEFDGRPARRICAKGHDTAEVGRVRSSGYSYCARCIYIKNHGQTRDNLPPGRRGRNEEARQKHLERISDEYLRLRDLLWMTPQAWLRDEIEEKMRRLEV